MYGSPFGPQPLTVIVPSRSRLARPAGGLRSVPARASSRWFIGHALAGRVAVGARKAVIIIPTGAGAGIAVAPGVRRTEDDSPRLARPAAIAPGSEDEHAAVAGGGITAGSACRLRNARSRRSWLTLTGEAGVTGGFAVTRSAVHRLPAGVLDRSTRAGARLREGAGPARLLLVLAMRAGPAVLVGLLSPLASPLGVRLARISLATQQRQGRQNPEHSAARAAPG
jgi:hypothetical protein